MLVIRFTYFPALVMMRSSGDKNVVISVGSRKIEWTVKEGPIKRREKNVRVR